MWAKVEPFDNAVMDSVTHLWHCKDSTERSEVLVLPLSVLSNPVGIGRDGQAIWFLNVKNHFTS